MSLIQTTGRLRYTVPLLLIVAVAACSKQDEAATPAAGAEDGSQTGPAATP